MMKKLSVTLSLFLTFAISLKAQNLKLVNTTLSFVNTTEIDSSTAELQLFNDGQFTISVKDVDLFGVYAHQAFSVSDTAFSVAPGDTETITVKFKPDQNIDYNMALVVKTASGFGHIEVRLQGQGEFSKTYYSSTQNISGGSLLTTLNTLLGQNYTSLGYTTARDNMYGSVDNDSGVVECVYTGRTATFNTRAGANTNNFNCEHTFPQGKFNSNEPMKSDLHHLFPVDVTANSERGNDPYGIVTNASWSNGGSKSDGSYFEPRDAQKGAGARALMYFVVRYQDYTGFFAPQESLMRQWSLQFLPTQKERDRNDAIYALQNNRNPFVDYPQLARRIPSLVSSSVNFDPDYALYSSDDTITLAKTTGRFIYDYVVYNDGNRDLSLDNFSLSDTSLHFVNGNPGTITLQPQQSTTVKISFNSANIYSADLQYTTNDPMNVNMDIPIKSGVNIGLDETVLAAAGIYPNPAHHFVNITLGGEKVKQVWISNVAGEKHQLKVLNGGRVDVADETPGFYMLMISTNKGHLVTQKLLIY